MFKKYIWMIALLALVALFAACKGESSPTAPPVTTGGGTTTTGGGTTPSGTTVSLTTSTAMPLVGTTSLVSATVTINGQPAPNGTAVEFTTTLGTFTESNTATMIRTTTNGVATATLSFGAPGPVTVSARVADVVKSTIITFSSSPVIPPVPSTAPTITSISPASGKPQGGDTVTITGTNFRNPIKVLFEFTDQPAKDAFVVPGSVTSTSIQVITPSVNLSAAQQHEPATISVIVGAGTGTDQKVTASTPFSFQLAILTPAIYSVSPPSGPKEGGTKITIFGSGFQAPTQVFFGGAPLGSGGALTNQAELQIVSIEFDRIIAVTPPSAATAVGASQVNLRIINLASNKEAVLGGAFRYITAVSVTAVAPTEGLFTGGTRIQIDGAGFDDPVAVTVAGVAAQVIKVTGSQIQAITSGVQPAGCADVKGAIVVTNISTMDSASGPEFIYRVPKPVIVSVASAGGGPVQAGGSVNITVANANGVPRFTIGGTGVTVGGSPVVNPDGTVTYTVIAPSTLMLGTMACPTAGASIPIPAAFDVVYTSATTSCTDTLTKGLTVAPPAGGVLTLLPTSLTMMGTAAVPATMTTPAVPARNGSGVFNIVNTGTSSFTITSITSSPNPPFTNTPVPAGAGAIVAPCGSVAVGVTYQAGASGSQSVGATSVTTSAGGGSVTLVGSTQ